jgi:endonuclease III
MIDKNSKENILSKLENDYYGAYCKLEHENPFELLIATILSAQCTDVRVNIVTSRLFKTYSTPKDFAMLEPYQLEPLIKSCGVYKNKALAIVMTSRKLLEDFAGEVPSDMKDLMSLRGVGRKTANVVMANAFGKDAIAVDTHVFRVSNRIGLANADNVFDTEKQLMKAIQKDKWSRFHHYLIWHGRSVCKARKPLCEICSINRWCKYYEKSNSNV